MIPTQEMVPYPVFGDNATKVQPDDPKYAAGFDPGDVLPAEWLNWLLNRASGAVTKLNAGALSMEQEINNVLEAGAQTPDAEETDQLITAIAYLINQAVLVEQQKPAVGVPTLWMGTKPDWALDFGNGAATKYLWANYPKLNNAKFKDILDHFKTTGGSALCADYDATGFYVPDLRGMMPKVVGSSGKSYGHDAITTVGAVMTERLPNIKGSVSIRNSGTDSSSHILYYLTGSGGGLTVSAMAGEASTIVAPGNSNKKFDILTMNAHSHSTIYTDSAHVSPLSFGAMYIVRYE